MSTAPVIAGVVCELQGRKGYSYAHLFAENGGALCGQVNHDATQCNTDAICHTCVRMFMKRLAEQPAPQEQRNSTVEREKFRTLLCSAFARACQADKDTTLHDIMLFGQTRELIDYVCGPAPAPKPPETVTTEEFARWKKCQIDDAAMMLHDIGVRCKYTTCWRWNVADIKKHWPGFKVVKP